MKAVNNFEKLFELVETDEIDELDLNFSWCGLIGCGKF